jgi:IgGFc binding protein
MRGVAQHLPALGTPGALGVVLGVLLGGCSSGAGTADGGDASPEVEAGAALCSGATTCVGTAVRACRDGQPAEVLGECAPDQACSLGRCVSPACAMAEQNRASFIGCLFYTLDLDNVTSDDPLSTSVLLTNPGQAVANVALERRGGQGGAGPWTTMSTTQVAPLQAARVVLSDSHFEGGGKAVQAALRLSSDLPITAAHIQSDDDVELGSSSTGGTILLPAHVLGQRYRAVTYPQVATPRLLDTPGSRAGAGQIVIVGTQDRTAVTVRVSARASLGPEGGAPPTAPGGQFKLMLDDGDLFQLFSSAEGDDLTGSEITADKPVAVFSGNISTMYGRLAAGINSPDMAHEQLLPVTAWGLSFVAAALPPQAATCDSLLGMPGASIWRIVADRDGTQVRFSAASKNVVGLPASTATTMLKQGEVLERVVSGGSFTVTSTFPIMVMQGMDCEPTLSAAVSADPLLKDLRFAVLPNFDTMLAIVRKAGQPIFLDGARIEDSLFEPAGGGFDVAQVPLEVCPGAAGVCAHHLEGRFGLTLRGMDVLSSYAMTAPTWVPCVDPHTPGCID